MSAWHERPFLAVDTETTGVNVATDRIVELATAVIEPDGSVSSSWSAVVNPGVDIPAEAAAIHGITDRRAREEGVAPEVALRRVARYLATQRELPVVVYNASFDIPLLVIESARHGVEFPALPLVIDPLVIDKQVDQYRRGSRRLVDVAALYDVALSAEDAHGALADATAAGRVARALVDRNIDLRDMTLTELFVWQSFAQERQRASFEDYMRTQRDPSFSKPAGWPLPVGLAA